jgi:hypothetical protein
LSFKVLESSCGTSCKALPTHRSLQVLSFRNGVVWAVSLSILVRSEICRKVPHSIHSMIDGLFRIPVQGLPSEKCRIS